MNRLKKILGIWLFLCALGGLAAPCSALEHDPYNLPSEPLEDVGPQVDAYLSETLAILCDKLNQEIAWHQRGADEAVPVLAQWHQWELEQRRGPDRLAEDLFWELAIGAPETPLERWLCLHEFAGENIRHQAAFEHSIYADALPVRPFLLVALAPTLNIYGVCMGTDKPGHIIQQGYQYFRAWRDAIRSGTTEAQAHQAALRVGWLMECGWAGSWSTGVFSNADLAANYAGFKLYRNLTEPVAVGDRILEPIFVLRDGLWEPNPRRRRILEPLISRLLDEAFNANLLEPELKARVAPHLPPALKPLPVPVAEWFGESYGRCDQIPDWWQILWEGRP